MEDDKNKISENSEVFTEEQLKETKRESRFASLIVGSLVLLFLSVIFPNSIGVLLMMSVVCTAGIGLIVIIPITVIIGRVVIIVVSSFSRDSNDSKKIYKSERNINNKKALVKYILESNKRDVQFEEMKDNLVRNGWSDSEITEAIGVVVDKKTEDMLL